MQIIVGDVILEVKDRKKSYMEEHDGRVIISIGGKSAVVGAQELIVAVDTINKMSCRL